MKMIKNITQAAIVLTAILSLAACNPDSTPKEVEGWAPVYESDLSDIEIKSEQPRAIVNGGKIYMMNSTLYQVEEGLGIHVINLSDPSQPKKVAFITIDGAHEISIKGQYLYSNNYNDLVVVDISDISAAHMVKRMKNTFRFTNNVLPPERGYFECIDPDKGTVIDWKKITLYSPKCKY